jgi:UDP-glucose 4-epimerase
MRILITGVAGFIGSNLAVRLLAEKHQVIGVDNLAFGIKEQISSGVEFHPLDIRSKDIWPLFQKIDAVFHLAAKNCISDCEKDPLETADINIQGFANVLEAARQGGLPKVIYAESSALYEGSNLFPTPETEVHPRSFYAMSKHAGMGWAETYRKAFGLKTTALRYFCVYGPRQDYRRTVPPLMSAFIIKLLKGEQPTIYGSGKKKRDFVYVDDVNDFHVQCLTDPRTDGETFNLGSGENYSVAEIFEKIQGLLKTHIKPTYKTDLPGEAEITLGDITKARSMGWSPKVSLDEGLKRSIEYIRREVLPSL